MLTIFLFILICAVNVFAWDEKKHVETVNSNFQKVDASLRIINDNFKNLDFKVNENILRIDKVANETNGAFEQASKYFKLLQEEIDSLKEIIEMMHDKISKLQETSNSTPNLL